MKAWVAKARELLWISLDTPKHELNELDWKAALSPDKKRLSEHLSAFSNHPGGGFLVYGIDRTGIPRGITGEDIQKIITQLTNLGRQAVDPPIALDHSVETYESIPLLFVFIAEAPVKPVHLRGKGIEASFIRSGGSTRIASRPEIGNMMLHSRTPRWEDLRASMLLTDEELIERLNTESILTIAEKRRPSANEELLDYLAAQKFVVREPSGGGYITNLGAITGARRISDFEELSRKAVRVVVYNGLSKAQILVNERVRQQFAQGNLRVNSSPRS